jgi:hypothetical protein
VRTPGPSSQVTPLVAASIDPGPIDRRAKGKKRIHFSLKLTLPWETASLGHEVDRPAVEFALSKILLTGPYGETIVFTDAQFFGRPDTPPTALVATSLTIAKVSSLIFALLLPLREQDNSWDCRAIYRVGFRFHLSVMLSS